MEVDSCGSDNFYDEIASFIPQPGDYSLDDIDEILRSTDSQLDSSIDFSTFVPHHDEYFKMPVYNNQQQQQILQPKVDEFNFDFSTLSSPATTDQSIYTSSYKSERTSSTSSTDGDRFNPDEFINFLNEDDIKVEEFQPDSVIMDIPQCRNTPSPTGSCSSSCGSSTSGIQSDASSVSSMQQPLYASDARSMDYDFIKIENNETTLDNTQIFTENSCTVPVASSTIIAPTPIVSPPTSVLPLSVPVIPMPTTTTIFQPISQVQPINVLQIPLKTVPLGAVKPLNLAMVNFKKIIPATTSANNSEAKIAPKTTNLVAPAKVVSPAVQSTIKATTPTNSKPKTIYLSSNDFKALMQKGTKIGGSGMTGTMPRIIMKTPNGKVITTNKLMQSTTSIASASHFVPKLIKTNGPLVIKQQPTKVSTSNVAAMVARTAVVSNRTPDLSIYKGILDEKMLKKQQRMIKNRESASLSRKKKKEYVVSLESRINKLEKENCTLKGENTTLRSQLVAFAQTCQCKHSNVSEFILNSLNVKVSNANGNCGSEHHHVKIAPKPAPKSIKQRMTAASVKKNVAVLFAMAFMVTMNVGNFQTYLNKSSMENAVETIEEVPAAGRRLLWVESETEFKEKLNRSKRETELEVPPLHFLRPINRTSNIAVAVEQQRNGTMNESPLPAKCLGNSNQTENLRLASNLHKWIDGNDYLNLSMHGKFDKNLKSPLMFKMIPDYMEMKSIDLPLQGPAPLGKQKRKLFLQHEEYESKQRKTETTMDNGKNSLDFFKPKIKEEYLRLFKGIKRQDDTFYVLSFNMDHILLPASAYNKSSRPKMSLMLPSGDPSLNGDIVLMQIDCEVVNTTELELKSDMIPEKLRPNKYGNVHLHPTQQSNEIVNNDTKSAKEEIQDESPLKEEVLKEKTAPRTYFMTSSKSQMAARKKSAIVKLSSNDSVERGVGNMNSTLFSKITETVEDNKIED